MKQYPIYLMDADNTLFDFHKAERQAFFKTFALLSGQECTPEQHACYSSLNAALWEALERREITKAELQDTRFSLFLQKQKLPGNGADWNNEYLNHLAEGNFLLDGAMEVCQTLAKTSRLYLATNGITRVQKKRLRDSAIFPYISGIFVSEEAGAEKPSLAYFAYVLERLGNPPEDQVLIVGDSLTSDMAGGIQAGIDTCWYNPGRHPFPQGMPITWQISHLKELLTL